VLSEKQKSEFVRAIKAGLRVLYRAPPVTGSEWADEHFFLSGESSYIKGKWKTHPYQVAILNAICNDAIEEIDLQKGARTGYTKIIVIAIGYKIEHKNHNVAVWQPNDNARDKFSKLHVDTMIRDVPPVKAIFPWVGKKHRNNSMELKIFQNQHTLFLLGGKAAANYREISVDDVFYDELSQFERNVERQGSPTTLGDKRLEGSVFGKSVRGSTPTIAGECQIEEACKNAPHYFKRYVPCIHCGEFQILEFGGKDAGFGLKWDDSLSTIDKPKSVFYLCKYCAGVIKYADYHEIMDAKGYWQSESGLRTYDGMSFLDLDGEIVPTPEIVAFHVWSAYSHNSPWSRIVKDWFKAQESREKLQAFVNTTLGETWEEDESEKIPHSLLHARREHYKADVPDGVRVIVAGIDTQGDRLEMQVDGYGAGEERWTIAYYRIYGDPSRQTIWDKLGELIRTQYTTESGALMGITLACVDHGGHYSDEVNALSVKMGARHVIPIKGASIRNKPVITFPRKPNANKVYLTLVGTDTAKTLIYQRYNILDPGPGYIHWPVSEQFDEDYFKQATAEERRKKYKQGIPYYEWDAKGKRNEALDCSVYSLAAIRILQQHFLFDLSNVHPSPAIKKAPAEKKRSFIGRSGPWM